MPGQIADNTRADSLATHFRRRRLQFFLSLLTRVEPVARILDVGGVPTFWTMMQDLLPEHLSITLLNIEAGSPTAQGIQQLIGDARCIGTADRSFDVVFSNSVIEHVGTLGDQSRMAQEIMRVGRRYFLQTPNRAFPLEPHFLVPLFQFWPVSARVWLLQHFDLGWYPRLRDRRLAQDAVGSVNLLSRKDLLSLFPGGNLWEEKAFGMVKSYVIYGGWERPEI